uniref:PIN7 domain-containing protein n=1 Tax=Strongyloides venezuelensis TaxID=75913 RepID=A0A0K0FWS0_STRVS
MEKSLFIDLSNTKKSNDDIKDGIFFALKHSCREYFIADLQKLSLSYIQSSLLKKLEKLNLFTKLNILRKIDVVDTYEKYFAEITKFAEILGLKNHSVCICLFNISSGNFLEQETQLIPSIEWSIEEWKNFFKQLDSKKRKQNKDNERVQESHPLPELSRTITNENLKESYSPEKIVAAQAKSNDNSINSITKIEYYEVSTSDELSILTNENFIHFHLSFFVLDTRIAYCYSYIEKNIVNFKKMLGKSNSVYENFKAKAILNLLTTVKMKKFEKVLITILDKDLFNSLKKSTSFNNINNESKTSYSEITENMWLKLVFVKGAISNSLINKTNTVIKSCTKEDTKNYEIDGVIEE